MSSKLKENKDANAITEVAVLKAKEANEIRERYMAICEIPENPIAIELGKQEIGNEWGALAGIQEVGNAGQIGKLNSLRYEIQQGETNLPRGKSEIILENEPPVMGDQFRQKKITPNMGTRKGELEISKNAEPELGYLFWSTGCGILN